LHRKQAKASEILANPGDFRLVFEMVQQLEGMQFFRRDLTWDMLKDIKLHYRWAI
jgi:hypothetical protein